MAELSLSKSTSQGSEERDVRVEDYLNDKLQTHVDLENLDSLLENVRQQQSLLKQQLQEAEAKLDEASKASHAHSANLLEQAQDFKRKQANIDRRLLIVTQSETSDDAVKKFNVGMENLKRLDVATEYVELLKEVDKLNMEARRNFKSSPQAALQPYLSLQNLTIDLKQAQPAAEHAAPHLVDHVEGTAKVLWKQMKDAFAAEFEDTLATIKWPSKDVHFDAKIESKWRTGVQRLLELQEPELKEREKNENDYKNEDPLVLLPLEVMAKPLKLRFSYHFNSDRPTNRLDKPEYFLSHIVGLLNTYDEFFAVYLQPILRRHFKGSNLALNPVYIDSTSALITALLPVLRQKIFNLLPQIAKQPQLLSHLMHELMSFDSSLKEDWNYDGSCGADGWKGLTWEVLVKKDWFGKWLQVEKDFALSRYQNIMDAPESREIDYDSVDPGMTKPIKAAIRVNDLLETVTDRYRPLTSFSQKLRFLIDIQIAIFDKFHNQLHSSLEAYLTRTSSIARTVQGVSKEEQSQLQGLSGLEHLCHVYGSSEYLEKRMRDWSDDVFFLELWDELQFRARENAQSGRNIAGNMSVQDVAGCTSSAVGSDEDTGALFDETASAFRRLRVRTEVNMQELLIHGIRENLRPYGRINPWSSLSSETIDPSSLTITAELDSTIQQLASYLSFLSKVLAEVALRRIYRQLSLSIQSYLWDTVLMRNNFSTYGGAQFARDVLAIWEVVDRYLGPGQGEIGMKKMAEALRLLAMPARPQQGEDEAGMKEGREEGEEEEDEEEGGLDIWQIERRVFQSNESARDVLEELGMGVLSESEARNVLERRIELGN